MEVYPSLIFTDIQSEIFMSSSFKKALVMRSIKTPFIFYGIIFSLEIKYSTLSSINENGE